MNDTLKKVLKYIGVGAIGFFIGIGSLIGISSCNSRSNIVDIASKDNLNRREAINFGVDDTFTFAVDFNYNAFFQHGFYSDYQETFLNVEYVKPRSKYPFLTFGGVKQSVNYIYIDTPNFYCNGILYNRFKITALACHSSYNFLDADNNIIHTPSRDDGTNLFVYFASMSYQFSGVSVEEPQREIEVCNREKLLGSSSNNPTTTINYNVTWLASSYRTITSASDEWNGEYLGALMVLEMCNNFSELTGFDTSYTDVGLTNVFTLLSSAFSSLIPILNISIIPGITIGLLLFIPLIAGIILLTIWIVKR